MRNIKKYSFLVAFLVSNSLYAQVFKIPEGGKIRLHTESANTVTTTVMGQDIEVVSASTNETETEFINVTANGYTMRRTLKRIKTVVESMGQTQTIDSEKADDKNNAAYAEVFEKLNKGVDLEIENNKVKDKETGQEKASMNNLTQGFAEIGSISLHGKDILKLVPGYTWDDSSKLADGFLVKTKNSVSKVDDNGIELLAVSNMQIKTTISQAGMDAVTDLTGTSTSKRLYNKTTGLLISEESESNFSGKITAMGMDMPVRFKDKSATRTN